MATNQCFIKETFRTLKSGWEKQVFDSSFSLYMHVYLNTVYTQMVSCLREMERCSWRRCRPAGKGKGKNTKRNGLPGAILTLVYVMGILPALPEMMQGTRVVAFLWLLQFKSQTDEP